MAKPPLPATAPATPATTKKAKKAAPRAKQRQATPSNASESQATPKGRPSSFTQEIGDRICEGLADGISLRTLCLNEDMPSKSTVFRWLADKAFEAFRDQYAHAREAQADTLVDDMLDIADEAKLDTYTDKDGNVRTDTEVIGRSKLRIDTRKWIASKMRPKKYGDKLELAGDADSPLIVEIVRHGTNPAPE